MAKKKAAAPQPDDNEEETFQGDAIYTRKYITYIFA